MLQDMLFRRGDSVTVRSNLSIRHRYDNINDSRRMDVDSIMVACGGRSMTVGWVTSHSYDMEYSRYHWTDDMFVEGHRIKKYLAYCN